MLMRLFWRLRYTNIHVGQPQIEEDYVTADVTPQVWWLRHSGCVLGTNAWKITIATRAYLGAPQVCRLRDMTYAAPITVDCEYMRGRDKVAKSSVFVGRMPLMLRSDRCARQPVAPKYFVLEPQ